MLDNINILLNNFLNKNSDIKALVLGVSGGIDSALVATLMHMFTKDRVKLIGLSLPTMTNALEEKERAEAICVNFCDKSSLLQIGNATTNFISELIPELEKPVSLADKIRIGNVKARIRMIRLYDEARKNKGLVLSTDNYTEYLLGFWTIFGDCGDLGIIQQLFKTEVYGLVKYIVENINLTVEQRKALQSCIDAKPTDGLGVSDNDLEQLNPERKIGTYIEGYKEVDDILIEYLNGNIALKDTPIIQRYNATHFKRNHPHNFIRETLIN
jgi:nicotinamide-nucleotide amidase